MTQADNPKTLWSPVAMPPQRYSSNFARYVELGGTVDPERDALGFAAGGQGDGARFFFFCLMLDQIAKEELAGELAELGVYKGHTATLVANIARRLGKTAYLFDTYEGFNQSDLQGIDSGKAAQFKDTSLPEVRALVGEENVRYIQGFFPDSTSQIQNDLLFCLVHIDCDLYAPALSALDYFYPRMAPGGFMVIHDYSSLGWSGAERAVDEFFADKVESIILLPDSAGSAIIRKAKSAGHEDNWRIRKSRRLFSGDWVSATKNALAEILGSGWSVQESWGIWGVDASHEIILYPPVTAGRVLELDLDVHAALEGKAASQEVAIFANGTSIGSWGFAADRNRGVRTVRVSLEVGEHSGQARRILLEFKPDQVVIPDATKDGSSDTRSLGMALHRLRVRTN